MFFFFPQTLRISEKQLLLGIGESFVTFIGRYGYDVVLSALGMCLPPVCLFIRKSLFIAYTTFDFRSIHYNGNCILI